MLSYYMPVRLYSGINCLKTHCADLISLGKQCLIVTGGSSAQKSGALNDTITVLDKLNIGYTIFNDIRQNPTLKSCMEAGKSAHRANTDFIIGIGGGSPLDAAKAVAVLAANPDLSEDDFYGKKWDNTPLPIILIGTTSGTGSEVTKVSVLTDSKGRKHSIHDDLLFARLAFGDPTYTHTMPESVTVSTGVDILAHCTESYFSKKSDEISRSYAVRGIRLMYPALSKAASGKVPDIKDREALYEASILAGLAINTTGTCFPHNVGYYLTEKYSVPHGIACAVFETDLLDYESEFDPTYAEDFFKACGISKKDICELIIACIPDLGIRFTEDELSAVLPRWDNNNSVKNTRGNITCEKIEDILRRKFL